MKYKNSVYLLPKELGLCDYETGDDGKSSHSLEGASVIKKGWLEQLCGQPVSAPVTASVILQLENEEGERCGPQLDVPLDALVDRHERDLPDCFGRSAFLSLPRPSDDDPPPTRRGRPVKCSRGARRSRSRARTG